MRKQEINELRAYLQSLPRLADTDKDARVKRACEDFWYFIQTYFPHHVEHAKTDNSHFRKFIHKNLENLSFEHRKLLFTAYRGGAKTTTISQLFTLWQLVKKSIRFGVVISATDKTTASIFEFYKAELEDNVNLQHDFDLSFSSVWREQEIVIDVGGHLCKLQGFSAGKKLRGIKFLSYRPDFIIIDDIENDEQVESKEQRDKLHRWVLKAVMKLPSRKSFYRLIVVGTVLHMDGLLKRLEQREDFKSFNFPLVRQFPHDPDNPKNLDGLILDDPDIDGAEVMQEYFEDKDSFMSEFQNTPISKESLLFEGYETFEIMPKCDVYYMGLDPALGKKKGAYFGIAVIGKKGNQFYGSAKGYRISPTKLIPRIISQYSKLQKIAPTTIACETVQFQEFFKDTLKKESIQIGIPLSVKPMGNNAHKDLRIDSMAPLVNDGTIKVCARDALLIEELETYPKAPHKDLLDALEMAWRLFSKASGINYKEAREKIKKRNFGRFKNRYA